MDFSSETFKKKYFEIKSIKKKFKNLLIQEFN